MCLFYMQLSADWAQATPVILSLCYLNSTPDMAQLITENNTVSGPENIFAFVLAIFNFVGFCTSLWFYYC